MFDRAAMTRRRFLAQTGALAGGGLLSAARVPSAALAASPGREGGTLRVAQIEEVTNFDPALMSTQDLGVLINNVYEGLVTPYRDTTNLVGRLARKWEISPDGKVITFHLRPNVKFHDGTAFDAAAVRFSIERVQKVNKGPAAFIQGVSAEVVDDHTVKVHASSASPRLTFKALPLVMMVSPTAIKAHEQDGDLGQKWLQAHSAGTGPYTLAEVSPGQRQVYVRFDDYWRGWQPGQASRVEYIVQLDQSVARLMLERGDLDMTPLKSPDDYVALKGNRAIRTYVRDFPAPQYMMMNVQVKPLDDPRVRKAIEHCWNRAAWNAANRSMVAEQLAPAPVELLGRDYKPIVYPYDLQEAKRLLAQAGHPNGGFKLTHYYIEGDTHKKAMGELLRDELAKVGITMDIRSVIAARMFDRIHAFGETRNPASAMDMITIYTPARFFDLHNWLDWHFNSKAWQYGRNFMFYANPEVDRLLGDAAAAPTDAAALPLYRRVSDIVMRDAPTIMIERLKAFFYTRGNITGFYFDLLMYSATATFYDIRKA